MPKYISQETFNGVVAENITEFGMTKEEAVKDAIAQFKAQGVNLSNIVKVDATEVTEKISNLPNELTDKNIEELNSLISLLDGNISLQVLAGKEGLYDRLVNALETSNIRSKVVDALTKLMNGYPDLLESKGSSLIISYLSDQDVSLIVSTLKWLNVCVKMHEQNRTSLLKLGIIDAMKHILTNYGENPEVCKETCNVISVFLVDDDVRVLVGNTHENARTLANETLDHLVNLMIKHLDISSTILALLEALTKLVVRDEYCVQVHKNKGLECLLCILEVHRLDETICRQGLLLLKGLLGSDDVRSMLVHTNGVEIVVDTLQRHFQSADFAVAACMCIGAMCLRNPQNSQCFAAANGPEALVTCLCYWKKNKQILKFGCSAIRNQLSRCPTLREDYLNLEIQDLLLNTKDKQGKLDFEAKCVLVDLGFDVKLNEEWKGQGKQLSN